MPENVHPPIDLGILQDLEPEEVLAQEAFSMLLAHAQEVTVRIDDATLPVLVTDAMDLASKADDFVAMRLRSLPVLIVDTGSEPITHTDTANYFVIDVEHRQVPEYALDDYDIPAYEAPVDWEKYIRIIINTLSTQDVMVLDGQTHRELTAEEIGIANYIVSLMRHEARDGFFDDNLRSTAEAQAQNVTKLQFGKYAMFDSTDFMQLSYCESDGGCGAENEACEHNPHTLN